MPDISPDDEERDRAITRLVDADPAGDGDRLGDDPALAHQVRAERQVAGALRSEGAAAPPELVAAIEARVQAANGPGGRSGTALRRPSSGRRFALGWRPPLAAGALAAACAVIVLVAVGVFSGGTVEPSIAAAARLARAPSTGPAPAASSSRLLDVSYAGVTYPNYARFAVAAVGRRSDRIGGRPALTVFYRLPNGIRLSYTVFSGRPIRLPSSARRVVYDGVPLHLFSAADGLRVVTLVRFGRTCVLAAPARADVILGLAAAPVRAQAA